MNTNKLKHEPSPELKRLFDQYTEKKEPFIFLHEVDGGMEVATNCDIPSIERILTFASMKDERICAGIVSLITNFTKFVKGRKR